MAEVQQRAGGSRGRGSARGGRGGYVSRGGRPKPGMNGKENTQPIERFEDQGEIGQLKKQYSAQLGTIREMFPDWTSEDIVFALHETGGDLERTIDRISEGNVAQWGEVKKKSKDKGHSKGKEATPDTSDPSNRSTRGRGDSHRGGRARGSERGRGAGRGRGSSTVNGARKPPSNEAPAATSNATAAEPEPNWGESTGGTIDGWDQPAQTGTTSPDASWEMVNPAEAATPPAVEQPKAGLRPDGTRSWASVLGPAKKPQPAPAKPKAAHSATDARPVENAPVSNAAGDQTQHSLAEPEPPSAQPTNGSSTSLEANLTPTKDPLTERNLEQVEDTSKPIETATAASTAGTNDPRSAVTSVTPLNANQAATSTTTRPSLGGYATTAMKATSNSGAVRSSSFQRRLEKQQEAVVMPEKHAVDRATVQFGSMGLNGDLDVDEEREEAETRAQPPQHSPLAPRASLPQVAPQTSAESMPAPRAAPGLGQPSSQSMHPQIEQPTAQQQSSNSYTYNQFNNPYGGLPGQSESSAPATKPYEPFGQQVQQQGSQQSFDAYSAQSQAPSQQHQHSQPSIGGFTTAAGDYSSYYTSDTQRNPYHNLYGGQYGQQGQNMPDSTASQSRGASAFGNSAGDNPSANATSQGNAAQQGRFPSATDAHNSGHSTPSMMPGHQAHHSQAPAHQSHHQTAAAAHHGGYPYGSNPYYGPYGYSNYMNQGHGYGHHQYGRERPMFDDVRRYDDAYLAQQQQQQQQQQHHYGYGGGAAATAGQAAGYGGGPYGGGKYGQPHQGYGMSPGYDQHSASPANAGAYGQQQQQPHAMAAGGRDAASAYGRTGSAQPSEGQPPQQQPHGGATSSNTFGGMPDVFGRSQSNLGVPHAPSAQPGGPAGGSQAGGDDAARGFADASKAPGGPSPAPGSARPASAATNPPAAGGAPPAQTPSQQQGYGGYPGQMGQASHYGTGLGGLGQGHQGGQSQHQGSAYGGYGGGFGGYYGSNSRGWGSNYGH